ncbi:THAP domain [Popillia japonica]|uniref:THAP domain n=1 Tax=Popillia japonica TaxID=7064 RepID=A0AAW1MZD1_POPJA
MKDKGRTYFKFPIRDIDRAKVWQTNCGNEKIASMDISALKYLKICERHFLRSQFTFSTKCKSLIKSAVPKIFDENEIVEEPDPPKTPPKEVKPPRKWRVISCRRQIKVEEPNIVCDLSPDDSDNSLLSHVKSEPQSPANESDAESSTSEHTVKLPIIMQSMPETQVDILTNNHETPIKEYGFSYQESNRIGEQSSDDNLQQYKTAIPKRFDQKATEEELAVSVSPLKALKTYSRKQKNRANTDSRFCAIYASASDSSLLVHVKSEPQSPASVSGGDSVTSDHAANTPTTMEVVSENKENIVKTEDEIVEQKYGQRCRETYRARTRRKAFSNTNVIDNLLKFKSEAVKTFIKMQLFYSRKSKWTRKEMQLAYSIFRKYPDAYGFLLEKSVVVNVSIVCIPSIAHCRFASMNLPALSSNTCCYKNCFKHRLKDDGITYFSFPIKDIVRTKVWQTNCGNKKVALMDRTALKHMKICERHFLSRQLTKNSKRKLLAKSAVPKRFDEKESVQESDPPKTPPKEVKSYSRQRKLEEPNIVCDLSPDDSDNSLLSDVKSEPQSPANESDVESTTSEHTVKLPIIMQSMSAIKVNILTNNHEPHIKEYHQETNRIREQSSDNNLQQHKTAIPKRFDQKATEEELVVSVSPLKALKTYSRKQKDGVNTDIRSCALDTSDSDSSLLLHVKSEPQSPADISGGDSVTSDHAANIPTTMEVVSENKLNILTTEVDIVEQKYEPRCRETYRARTRRKAFSNTSVIDNLLSFKSEAVKTFIKMQLFYSRKSKWTREEMQLAYSIFRKYPDAYGFLLEKYGGSKNVPFKDGGSKNVKLTEALVKFVVQDNLPFNIVEGKGFLSFMKEVAALYKVPTRNTIKNNIDRKNEVVSTAFKNILKKWKYFTITTDIWTADMQTRSLMGFTVHF